MVSVLFTHHHTRFYTILLLSGSGREQRGNYCLPECVPFGVVGVWMPKATSDTAPPSQWQKGKQGEFEKKHCVLACEGATSCFVPLIYCWLKYDVQKRKRQSNGSSRLQECVCVWPFRGSRDEEICVRQEGKAPPPLQFVKCGCISRCRRSPSSIDIRAAPLAARGISS